MSDFYEIIENSHDGYWGHQLQTGIPGYTGYYPVSGFWNNDTVLRFGATGDSWKSRFHTFLYFTGINLIGNETITESYIIFTAYTGYSSYVGVNIYGVSGKPNIPTGHWQLANTGVYDYYTLWDVPAFYNLSGHNTVSITGVVQAIINDDSWALNNPMMFLIKSTAWSWQYRDAYSLEGGASPQLYIAYATYSEAGSSDNGVFPIRTSYKMGGAI